LQVYTRGKPGKRAKLSIKELKYVAHFYASKLLSKKLSSNIDVTIVFDDAETIDKGVEGYCDWQDKNEKPREYIICLSSKGNKKDILETLAHEMKHVQQFATGILKDLDRPYNAIRWGNRVFTEPMNAFDEAKSTKEKGTKFDYKAYRKQPWEREAFRAQTKLYHKYKKYKEALNDITS
jgi:hypothetical protein